MVKYAATAFTAAIATFTKSDWMMWPVPLASPSPCSLLIGLRTILARSTRGAHAQRGTHTLTAPVWQRTPVLQSAMLGAPQAKVPSIDSSGSTTTETGRCAVRTRFVVV
ncbi:MAG: hypothetical protein NVS3B10_28940 [Polyangiales bacterium]